jgi:hypothetical protein
MTDAQLEEARYHLLFGEIAAQEKMAQSEEAAGHMEAAASWRAHFAKESGLTQEEAEAVKKIAVEYGQKATDWQAKYRETIQAVRRANPGVRMGRRNSPEIAALEQEREDLFPNVKAELVRTLGSRRFTQLDSYTVHSHDNARVLSSGRANAQIKEAAHRDPP